MSASYKSRERAGRISTWIIRLWGQRRRAATIGAAALTVAVAWHVVFGPNGLTVYQQKRTETEALTHQLHDLSRDNDALHSHVDRLQADPNAIEHEAREQFHYTRPGEVIITLPVDPHSRLTKEPGRP